MFAIENNATTTSIQIAIESIDKKHFFLPSIQRGFVWKAEQIELLFDSLMRGYPISSFLFWRIEDKNIDNFKFYEFLCDYNEEENQQTKEVNFKGQPQEIIAILDGQQRLTSLYIGLKGTYSYKLSSKKKDSASVSSKRKLYLNILKESDDDDREYDFRFLTDKEAKKSDKEHLWFLVGDILDVTNIFEFTDKYSGEHFKFARQTLHKLYNIVYRTNSINFFLEKDQELDKVLDIFVRVNSGGTKLSNSDLLLSMSSATWKNKNAKEEITSFVKKINKIGDGFDIDKDFVLKSCLVLSDFKEIAFKVKNFNEKIMKKIEENWDNITESLWSSYNLLYSLGYNHETLASNNAVIPIAYYLYKKNNPKDFHKAGKYHDDREKIRLYLALALLKQMFSGQPDNVLRPIREIIEKENNLFPLESIIEHFKGSPKNLTFSDDDINKLFDLKYGKTQTFSVLALLYPSLDYRNKFDIDHIFPKTSFAQKNLIKEKIPESKIKFYQENYNCLANLQLLDRLENQEKSDTPFDIWLNKTDQESGKRQDYMKKNYIPPDISFELNNFEDFINKRTQLIEKKLKEILKTK